MQFDVERRFRSVIGQLVRRLRIGGGVIRVQIAGQKRPVIVLSPFRRDKQIVVHRGPEQGLWVEGAKDRPLEDEGLKTGGAEVQQEVQKLILLVHLAVDLGINRCGDLIPIRSARLADRGVQRGQRGGGVRDQRQELVPLRQAKEIRPFRGGQGRVLRRFAVDRRSGQGQESRFHGGHSAVSSGSAIRKPLSHID